MRTPVLARLPVRWSQLFCSASSVGISQAICGLARRSLLPGAVAEKAEVVQRRLVDRRDPQPGCTDPVVPEPSVVLLDGSGEIQSTSLRSDRVIVQASAEPFGIALARLAFQQLARVVRLMTANAPEGGLEPFCAQAAPVQIHITVHLQSDAAGLHGQQNG